MDFARLFCVGFDGHEAPDSILFALDRDGVGAVILFARNCRDAAQIESLCRRLREAGGEELWILVDQEGGRIRRVTEPDIGPAAAADMAAWPPERVEEAYATAGRKLTRLGFDFNLAPVADVRVREDNRVLEGRSFGDDAREVSTRVAAAVRGLRSAGLKTCAKHFPGLGDVGSDPHHELTRSRSSTAQFHDMHFPPFAAAIQAGTTAVMTTHLLAPALDAERMATYSPVIVQRYLEQDVGFRGLVLTDDLEMKGLPDEPALAAWQAFEAGHHLLLLCHDQTHQEQARRLFADRLSGDQASRQQVHRALDRQQPYRQPFKYVTA